MAYTIKYTNGKILATIADQSYYVTNHAFVIRIVAAVSW